MCRDGASSAGRMGGCRRTKERLLRDAIPASTAGVIIFLHMITATSHFYQSQEVFFYDQQPQTGHVRPRARRVRYNPIFCVPPILYGLCAGLFRPMLARRGLTLPRIALAFLPALVFGSVLYQSGALALVYGGASKQAFFLAQLASRSVQFAVTGAADILIVWMLGRSGVFSAVRLWPPVAVTGSERA